MKSPHDSFDEELKERLRNYAEEPERDLWTAIAPKIVSVNGSGLVWTHISTAIVGLSILFSGYQRESGPDRELTLANSQSPAVECATFAGTREEGGQSKILPSEIVEGKPLNRNAEPIQKETQYKEAGISNARVESLSFGDDIEIQTSGTPISEDSLLVSGLVPGKVEEQKVPDQKKEPEVIDLKKIFSLKNPTLFLAIGPTAGFQRVEASPNDNAYIQGVDKESSRASSSAGLRVELGMDWPVGKRMRVFGGLLYYYQKYSIHYSEAVSDNTSVTTGTDPGFVSLVPTYAVVQRSVDYELKSLGLQLGLFYRLSGGKDKTMTSELENSMPGKMSRKKILVHWIGAGVSFQRTLNNTMSPDPLIIPSSNAFANVYYRFQYPNVGKLNFILQPTYFYSLAEMQNSSSAFTVKPYGIGVSIGCTYRF